MGGLSRAPPDYLSVTGKNFDVKVKGMFDSTKSNRSVGDVPGYQSKGNAFLAFV
jgi:hypothetical protein